MNHFPRYTAIDYDSNFSQSIHLTQVFEYSQVYQPWLYHNLADYYNLSVPA